MPRRQSDGEPARLTTLILLLIGLISGAMVYTVLSTVLRPSYAGIESLGLVEESGDGGVARNSRVENGRCCRGINGLELWGPAVKWGSDFKFDTPEECCKACKEMCSGTDGPCLCNSWVFCGNKQVCGSRLGECWLKKQNDVLAPDRQEAGQKVMWTSGLIFGRGEGIVGMETEHGTMHIKLHPECAPYSVNYILELLTLRHCAGCQFHRAESRGQSWDSEGNHIKSASFGPPFALIQGILEADGTPFPKLPTENCPTVQRGSVGWVGSGPEFFISLANHPEWKKTHTVFGSILPEDMEVAEKIAKLPTKSDVWNNINVSVLEKPVPLIVQRMKKSQRALVAKVE